jgi:hypothetical protein
MKPIKITSFEQIKALYAKGLNICKGCQHEHAASCTAERFAVCTKQANKHAAPILAAMNELETKYKSTTAPTC